MGEWTSTGCIYAIDDDPSVLDSMSAVAGAMGLESMCFSSGEAFLTHVANHGLGIACVLVDARLKGMGGLQIISELRRSHPTVPVVLVTAYADVPMVVHAMELGCLTVLEKPYRDQQLWEVIVKALKKSEFEWNQAQEKDLISRELKTLTPSEVEVMNYLVVGTINKQIAMKCDISLRTVDLRRKTILEKMAVTTIPALIWKLNRVDYNPGYLVAGSDATEASDSMLHLKAG